MLSRYLQQSLSRTTPYTPATLSINREPYRLSLEVGRKGPPSMRGLSLRGSPASQANRDFAPLEGLFK